MSEPTITYDFEFGFLSGAQPLFLSGVDGRDSFAVDEERLKIALRPDADTLEEIIVQRQSLSYQRVTKRTVKPEPVVGQSDITLVEALA